MNQHDPNSLHPQSPTQSSAPEPPKDEKTPPAKAAKTEKREKKVKLSFSIGDTAARRFRAACALKGDEMGDVAQDLFLRWADRELKKHIDA